MTEKDLASLRCEVPSVTSRAAPLVTVVGMLLLCPRSVFGGEFRGLLHLVLFSRRELHILDSHPRPSASTSKFEHDSKLHFGRVDCGMLIPLYVHIFAFEVSYSSTISTDLLYSLSCSIRFSRTLSLEFSTHNFWQMGAKRVPANRRPTSFSAWSVQRWITIFSD